MKTITVTLFDDDWAAFQRASERTEESAVYYIAAGLCELAARIRAREAIERGDEPSEVLR